MKNMISNFEIASEMEISEKLNCVRINFVYRNNRYKGTIYHNTKNDIVTLCNMKKEGVRNKSSFDTMEKVRGAIQIHYREELKKQKEIV